MNGEEKMFIYELEGKTITQVQTFYAGNGCYMMEMIFTDGTAIQIEREHTEDHYLSWRIQSE